MSKPPPDLQTLIQREMEVHRHRRVQLAAEVTGARWSLAMQVVRSDEPDAIRLIIEGELTAVTVSELMRAIDDLTVEAASRIVVDLSELARIDSSGVGALVALHRKVRECGGRLGVTGLRGQPRAIFQLLRLDQALGVE